MPLRIINIMSRQKTAQTQEVIWNIPAISLWSGHSVITVLCLCALAHCREKAGTTLLSRGWPLYPYGVNVRWECSLRTHGNLKRWERKAHRTTLLSCCSAAGPAQVPAVAGPVTLSTPAHGAALPASCTQHCSFGELNLPQTSHSLGIPGAVLRARHWELQHCNSEWGQEEKNFHRDFCIPRRGIRHLPINQKWYESKVI